MGKIDNIDKKLFSSIYIVDYMFTLLHDYREDDSYLLKNVKIIYV